MATKKTDAKFNFVVSNDKLSVTSKIIPLEFGGKDINLEDIRIQLKEEKISDIAIDDELIKEILKSGSNADFICANGKLPLNGENGSLKFLFEFAADVKPNILLDGTADFKSINIIKSVKKGDKLVELIPLQKGFNGIDVYGNDAEAIDGKKSVLPMGLGTDILEIDGVSFLVAAEDGIIKQSPGKVSITEEFLVDGDVDFNTGNIDYKGSVRVLGDVKSGFNIIAGGDVEIEGTVEDAKIKSSGSVFIKGGFVGKGEGCIEANGTVTTSFIRNQTIKSKNILIGKEAFDCKLFAKDSIEVLGGKMGISGGEITAVNRVDVNVAGSENHTRVKIKIGTDFQIFEEELKLNEAVEKLEAESTELKDKIFVLEMKKINKKATEEDLNDQKDLKIKRDKIPVKIGAYQLKLKFIEKKKAQFSSPVFNVRKKIYTGVEIEMVDQIKQISEDRDGRCFVFSKGEIHEKASKSAIE